MTDERVRAYVDSVIASDPIYHAEEPRVALAPLLSNDGLNVLSSEALSGPAWVGVAQRGIDHRSPILQNLQQDFPHARFLLVVRRQDHYARSMYRQYIKTGGTQSLRRFFGEGTTPLFSADRFRYAPYVERIRSMFDNRLDVVPFELLRNEPKRFLAAIGRVLDVTPPTLPATRSNATRMGSRGLTICRWLNHAFRGPLNPDAPLPGIPLRRGGKLGWHNPSNLLQDHWPAKRVRYSAADEAFYARLLADCAQDNRRLQAHVDEDLGELGYF